MLDAVGEAIEALRNVPEVGQVYDQQHSDTHMRALLRLLRVKDTLSKGDGER